MDKKYVSYLSLFFVVCLWGLDYSVAKNALDLFEPVTLLFFKYAGGLVTLTIVKFIIDRRFAVRKKDIILFVMCSVTGQILYYLFEYSAMDYIPVSLITIMLSFVPVISILIERVAYGRKMSGRIIVGLVVSIIGVSLVVGSDFELIFEGRMIGYLLAFGAVLSWNAYNFITAKISERYEAISMAFNQIFCTVLLSAPFAFKVMPPASEFTPSIIVSIVYLGIGSAGIGYLMYVRGIGKLGPTIPAMFTNFLPVTSIFFSWIILGEVLGKLQIVGGCIVMAASCYVILEKSKIDRRAENPTVKS